MAKYSDTAASKIKFPDSVEVLEVKDLASKYASVVPFQFRIVHGFLSKQNNKDPTFTANEVYMAHLVTETDVVKITNADGEFRVPLNSLAKFGLIHDEQIECMTFEDVEELLFANPCPKIVAVRNDCIFPEVALKKNEILIVREIVRAKMGRNRIAMKFFSILQEREILLYKEQSVPFTTNPWRTQLHLSELEEYMDTDFMPCQAKIFPDGNSTLSRLLTSTTITLECKEKRCSVIVSSHSKGDCSVNSNFISIPAGIGITMTAIEPDLASEDYRQILEQSVDLLHHYSPSRVYPCLNSQTDEAYSIQAQLLSDIHLDREKEKLIEDAPTHYQGMLVKIKGASENKLGILPAPQKECDQSKTPPRQLSPDLPRRNVRDRKRRSWEGSEEPYGIAPLLTKDYASSKDCSSTRSAAGLPQIPPISIQDSRPVCLPSAAERSKHLPHKGPLNLPVSSMGSHHTEADYEEIDDFPFKDAGILSQSVYGRPPLPQLYSGREKNLKPARPQETTPVSHPYVKFMPNSPMQDVPTDIETRVCAAVKQTREMQEKLDGIAAQVREILLWQKQVDAELGTLKSARGGSNSKGRHVITKDMTPEEVTGMLDTIGLPQYKEAFSREIIDGVTFLGLDDVTLDKELQVSSKIHRLRILKLMDGDT